MTRNFLLLLSRNQEWLHTRMHDGEEDHQPGQQSTVTIERRGRRTKGEIQVVHTPAHVINSRRQFLTKEFILCRSNERSIDCTCAA
mmetsp:Transcript_28051/g.41307  ORF Transcript_28051/g.41307 Transcript_28051/m.41307 type:complete len:86 (-) Transcript_28051:56-313(-)